MPEPLAEVIKSLIVRINSAWPIDGNGIRVADGIGGRSINLWSGPTASGGSVAGGVCELRCYNATDSGAPTTYLVGVTWGRIDNRLVTAFLTADFTTLAAGTPPKYIYAKTTYSLTTFIPTAVELLVSSSVEDNTTTEVFTLIGTCSLDGSVFTVISKECGPVVTDACGLLSA